MISDQQINKSRTDWFFNCKWWGRTPIACSRTTEWEWLPILRIRKLSLSWVNVSKWLPCAEMAATTGCNKVLAVFSETFLKTFGINKRLAAFWNKNFDFLKRFRNVSELISLSIWTKMGRSSKLFSEVDSATFLKGFRPFRFLIYERSSHWAQANRECIFNTSPLCWGVCAAIVFSIIFCSVTAIWWPEEILDQTLVVLPALPHLRTVHRLSVSFAVRNKNAVTSQILCVYGA
jgi:hypothetical protein